MTHEEMIERFACKVCQKPSGLDPDKCHATIGRQRPLCREYNCCRIKEKSDEQLSYARSPIDRNIFLRACPGSGKTEVVALKAAYEIKNWNKQVGGLAVLTFTNNAADVIHKRVCQFAGIDKAGYPHFIGTLSSWLQGYIVNPFAHILTGYKGRNGDRSIRLVEQNCASDFLKGFQTSPYASSGPIKANQYSWDCEDRRYLFHSNSRTADIVRQAIAFTAQQKQELKEKKRSFLRHGYATHHDVEFICYRLLEEHPALAERTSKRFPLVLVDECQDLSWTEMNILRQLQGCSTILHFVGDLNQAIYEFKKVSPEKVNSFVGEDGFAKMELSDNFRSCQEIVEVCRGLVDGQGDIRGKCQGKMDTPCVFVTYRNDQIPSLPNWFEGFLTERGLDVSKSAIVARGWSTVSKLRPSGNTTVKGYQRRLAMSIHLWKAGGIQAMGDALKYMGQFMVEKWFPKYRSNSREYYCPDCVSSPLRWRLFLAALLDSSIENTSLTNLDQTWSQWAAAVRAEFCAIARACQPALAAFVTEPLKPLEDLDANNCKAPRGESSSPVVGSLGVTSAPKAAIRITTIHSVKGETSDAIMLVSAPSKQGTSDGYWPQWLEDPSSEAARLAYVASSRPKYLLVWAIPEQPNADYKQLEKRGLVLHPMDGGLNSQERSVCTEQ